MLLGYVGFIDDDPSLFEAKNHHLQNWICPYAYAGILNNCVNTDSRGG